MYIESEISNALLAGGLQVNLQGFQFLKEAIMETIKYPCMLQQLTKTLYPKIAALHHLKGPVVERSMRHVIDVAYRSQGLYGLNDLLSTPFFINNDKPCNGSLIAFVAELVKKNLYHLVATTNENENSDKAALVKEIQEFLKKYSNPTTID